MLRRRGLGADRIIGLLRLEAEPPGEQRVSGPVDRHVRELADGAWDDDDDR